MLVSEYEDVALVVKLPDARIYFSLISMVVGNEIFSSHVGHDCSLFQVISHRLAVINKFCQVFY